jgi:glycosyl transferase family 25
MQKTAQTLAERLNFYVINLDRSTDRMKRFKKDCESFPLPLIRISAIEGRTLTLPVEEYDAFMFFWNVGRYASPGEIGCYFSHVKTLKTFLESGKEFALICEDDAIPSPECYEVIQQAITFSESWDFVRLCGGRAKTSYNYRALTSTHNLCTSITGMIPAAAYIVNRHAAETLSKKLLPMSDLYDSALHHGRYGIRETTVLPNCFRGGKQDDIPSTIEQEDGGRKNIRNLKPWHFVFWTCRLFRLRIRVVRYAFQTVRIILRR